MNQSEIRKSCQDAILKDIRWNVSLLTDEASEEGLDRALFFLNFNVQRLMNRRKFWKEHPIVEE